ncbi:MAG: hypothetical protein BGO55_04140 [Sphingobacteriales bacterium 50-39]|nr:SGNH/GDSL hydrolase family protein [Sphingobacteriales bacterium]OJW55827.1 MAG: hypothetical protein BGO55_04140 [Sphingobacteriales bacterium 50-39]
MQKGSTNNWSKWKLFKFSVISILLLLVVAELAARIFFYSKFRGMSTSVYIQGSPIQAEDPLSVYNNRPFYVDYEKRFQHNEEGMKSLPGDFRMPDSKGNELWILLLGGSAMEGMGSNRDGKWFDITNVQDHPYNETIAAYLQANLQEKYPSRKVRVFNAAVSGFTLSQGFLKYQALSKKYNFDWVITMDGVNECDTLSGDEERDELAYNHFYFSTFPFHGPPLKYIVPVTQHSALFNTLKQEFYYARLHFRMKKNEAKGFPERKYWADQSIPRLDIDSTDPRVSVSCKAFLKEMHLFESRLNEDGKKYLFLVQPYLAFRDTTVMTSEERALNNYLRREENDKYKVGFLKKLYDTISILSHENPHIRRMTEVHKWPGWVFVDYCHFTSNANGRIAQALADLIEKDGKTSIFND